MEEFLHNFRSVSFERNQYRRPTFKNQPSANTKRTWQTSQLYRRLYAGAMGSTPAVSLVDTWINL
jgi:hypothetical protein